MADPTLGWLEKARHLCNDDAEFRKLGTCDARVGIKAGDVAFLVTFEAFECVNVQEVGVADLRDADFYLDMPRATWREFLNGRRNGDGGSLISYGVDLPGGIVKAESPLLALKFDRYHLTLQYFLDKVAMLLSPVPA